MKIYDFKRLVLNWKNKAFFLEEDIENHRMLDELLHITHDHNNVKIFFNIHSYNLQVEEFDTGEKHLVKDLTRDTPAKNILGEILASQDADKYKFKIAMFIGDKNNPSDLKWARLLDDEKTLKENNVTRFSKVKFVQCRVHVRMHD